MNLSFLQYLLESAKKSLVRFPLVLFSALFVFFTGVYLIATDFDSTDKISAINILLLAMTGVPLFFSIKVFAEQSNNPQKSAWFGNLIGFLILIGFGIYLASAESTSTHMPYIRFGLFNIFIHLIVAIAPFPNKRNQNGFWQYNRMLFTRFFLSLLYAGVMYLGLVLALVAIHGLFNIKIQEEIYGYLALFFATIGNIWIFMTGVDENIQELENSDEYPKGLKIFCQYILLGLVILYFLILYSYAASIILSNSWPKGVISYLIIGVSVLGYLTVLLLFPYSKEEKGILSIFLKVFNFMVLPLVILLFVAVGMRISAYGITVNRYFIVLLGIWLGTISIVRILKPTWIKIVPTSIACFVLLSSFGFWGVNFISEKSQINRLENIMTKMKLLKNGKLTQEFHYDNTDSLITSNPKITLSIKDENEINSIIGYLDTYHDFDNIYPWFTQNMDSIIEATKKDEFFSNKRLIKNVMGITYRYKKSVKDNYFSVKEMTIKKISPYDYRTNSSYGYNNKTFTIQNVSFYCSIDKKNQLFIVKKNKHEFISYSITKLIQKLQKKYKSHQYNIPQNEMFVLIEKDNYLFKVNFEHISLYDNKITNAKYFILIKIPSSEPSIDSTVIQ